MKLRKFFGLTSRSVLEQVRVELGPDAVIVANHATPDGIEVTALEGSAIDSILAPRATTAEPASGAAPVHTPMAATTTASVDSPQPGPKVEPEPWRPQVIATGAPAAPSIQPVPMAAAPASAAPAPTIEMGAKVMEQVAAMRELIEERLSLLAFSETLRRRPLAARLTGDLLGSGYSAALARELANRLPADYGAEEAEQWVTQILARNLPCVGAADEIVTKGGIYALVGPTGVGKTTTTAKLAARCVLRYGAGKLGLITTDGFRIGAQDQLRIYAKLLGVAVHAVSDRHDLKEALDAVRGRHLVLIDTVGIGQRDTRVAEQAHLLSPTGVRTLLLLNATSQGETLEEVVRAYRRAPEPDDGFAGCIVTKIDEACRTGTALDVAIRHHLPIHYMTNGQRVPEDLFLPEAELVVRRSLRARAKPTPFALTDDEIPLALCAQPNAAMEVLHA